MTTIITQPTWVMASEKSCYTPGAGTLQNNHHSFQARWQWYRGFLFFVALLSATSLLLLIFWGKQLKNHFSFVIMILLYPAHSGCHNINVPQHVVRFHAQSPASQPEKRERKRESSCPMTYFSCNLTVLLQCVCCYYLVIPSLPFLFLLTRCIPEHVWVQTRDGAPQSLTI